MDAHEQIRGDGIRERDALAQRQRAIVVAGQPDVDVTSAPS